MTACCVFSTEIIHNVITVRRQFYGHSTEQVLFIILLH